MKVFILAVVVLLVQSCRADVAQTGLQDELKQAQAKLDEMIEQVKTKVGLSKNPTGAEIVKMIEEQNQKAIASIKDLSKKLEDQVTSNPDAAAALKTLNDKVKEIKDNFHKENPEMAANADKLLETFKTTQDKIAKEFDDFQKSFTKKDGPRDNIEDFFKKAIDDGIAAMKTLSENVDKALTDSKKKS